MRRLYTETHGIVMMEFLIAMFPLMIAFLGCVQFAVLAVAKLTLLHSANTAVRAAVVVIEESSDLPGTPEGGIYGDLEAGLLEVSNPDSSQGGVSESSTLDSVQPTQSKDGPLAQLGDLFTLVSRDDTRINHIRSAAYIPMLAISPDVFPDLKAVTESPFDDVGLWSKEDSVYRAIGDTSTRLPGAFLYNLGALAVTFPDAESPDNEKTLSPQDLSLNSSTSGDQSDVVEFERGQDVTARITYLFRCRVPVVSALICHSGWAIQWETEYLDTWTLWEAQRQLGDIPRSYEEIREWQSRYDATKSRFAEREAELNKVLERKGDYSQVESPFLQSLLLMRPGARYMVLQAEATLPLQGARYYKRGIQDENES